MNSARISGFGEVKNVKSYFVRFDNKQRRARKQDSLAHIKFKLLSLQELGMFCRLVDGFTDSIT